MAKTYRGTGTAGAGTAVPSQASLDAAVAAAELAESNAAASASAASASETAAELAETNAETAETNAETAETNAAADAVSTAADAVSTAADAVSTAADAVSTAADAASTAADASATAADAIATAADLAATNQDTIDTAADAVATAADAVSTAADAASTASDATDTGVDAAATAADAIATAADAVSTAADVVTVAGIYDSFDDTYLGAKASDPTLDNDGDALAAGALYFNTTSDVLKAYDGATWNEAGSSTASMTYHTATAGQTTFSGVGDGAVSINYNAGYVMVMLNGVLLRPDEFTATDGTSIVLDTGATVGDTLQTIGFGTFDVQNVSQTETFQYSSTTATQTAITGLDDNSSTLAYQPGFIQVYYNGVLMADTDYTETSTSVLTLTDGVEVAGDIITIIAFDAFNVANTYTKTESDANFQPKGRSPWTTAYNAAPGAVAEVEVTGLPSWISEIFLGWEGMSSDTNGNTPECVLGISSGYVTAGYAGSTGSGGTGVVWPTDAVQLSNYSLAATVGDGNAVLTVGPDNTVHATCHQGIGTTNHLTIGVGNVPLGGTLDRLKVQWSAGANFDAGTLTILYR